MTQAKMLSVYFTNPVVGLKRFLFDHCHDYIDHLHLHLQGFLPNMEDVDVIHKKPINQNSNDGKYCNSCLKDVFLTLHTSNGIEKLSKRAVDKIKKTEANPGHPYVPGNSRKSGVTIGYVMI